MTTEEKKVAAEGVHADRMEDRIADLRERAHLLILKHARLPSKSKSVNDHASIVSNVCQIA